MYDMNFITYYSHDVNEYLYFLLPPIGDTLQYVCLGNGLPCKNQ